MNPYDVCVANIIVNEKNTFACNFDNLKSSHVDPNFNNDFYKWLEKMYGSNYIGHVEAKCGKVHEYLAMTLDYTEEGKFKVDVRKYLGAIIS